MKQILLLLIFLSSSLGMAQVGVNTANPDPSSMLDISATNKGVLVPRVNLANVTTITLDGTNTAATGLLIWNTNATTVGGNGVGFYFFNGTQWMPLTQAVSGNTLDQSYDQGGAGVGKNINATDGSVRVNGDDGFLVTGTFGTGNTIDTEITGAGTRMFFNPRKAAFRAGNVNGTQWDDAVIGNYSIAMGQNATASGNNSIALGSNITASGSSSVAFGSSNTASGPSSAAFGSVSYATSDAAFVGGLFNTASGVASTSFGYRSVASGGASTALGNDNYARSYGETVIGIGATDYTPLNSVSAHPSGATDRLFVVGNAIDSNLSFSIDPSERSNALVILKNGETGLGTNPTTGNRLTVGGKTATTNFQMTSGAAANYILQSDALGNATWANPPVDTDDQQIDVFSLTGTTLNLSLQNDGVATQTVNLASLDTDNQQIDVLTLTGDTLNISLQDDGATTQTLNLASLDNQATDVFSLTGTTLNLSLQNDGVATQTVNLSSLDTDNQIIDVLSLSGDTLSLSLQDDGVATQTLNLGAIDNQQIDVFSLTGNTLNLSLQNDGAITQMVDLSSLKDHDWYEVGTSNSPNAITDAIYHYGDVAIGKNTADYALDIFENESSKSYAAQINKTDVDGGQSAGLAIAKATNGSGIGSNIYNTISSINFFSETIGIHNYFTGNGSRDNTGMHNEFTVRSDYQHGIENLFDDVTGAQYGMINRFGNITGANASVGVQNSWIATNTVNSDCIGLSNNMSSEGSGDRIGVNNSISGSGSGNKFGVFTSIDATAGGTHYGIYSNVRKANSYSGYFQGRVAIGTLPSDIYIMPLIRGTNGQIMQTDGVGNVSWVTPPADTDNQTIDVLSLSGDTLNISLQDDAVSTQTLNLSSIDNQATDVFSLTGSTLNLSLQNDGVATQTVDLSTLANDWKLTGNAGTTAGTNFIGTTDAQDLDFRTNNITKLTLTQRGQLSITNTGGSVLVGGGAGEADDFTSNQNTFIGTVSGESTSSGNLNSALGFNTLNVNTLGFGNTAVGANALNVNVDGNNNTGLGRGANVSTSNLTNATAVGFNSTVNASNKIRFGNAAITVVEGQVAYTNPSDARFKFNVKEDVPGLDFIKKLKPVTYNFDTKKFDEHLNKNRTKEEVTIEDFATSTAIIRTGFLAQDVEKICADLGYNFDGLHIPDASNPTDNYGIAYSQFIMPIVKAVQEQQAIIETQKIELEQLKSELEKYKMLEERIKALEQK